MTCKSYIETSVFISSAADVNVIIMVLFKMGRFCGFHGNLWEDVHIIKICFI